MHSRQAKGRGLRAQPHRQVHPRGDARLERQQGTRLAPPLLPLPRGHLRLCVHIVAGVRLCQVSAFPIVSLQNRSSSLKACSRQAGRQAEACEPCTSPWRVNQCGWRGSPGACPCCKAPKSCTNMQRMSRACLLDARVQRGLDAAVALDGAQLGPGAQLALAHRAQQVCGEMERERGGEEGSLPCYSISLHLNACSRREGEQRREGS